MQKLLERTVGIRCNKRVLLYSASITALLAIIIISAVVLNTNALSVSENTPSEAIVTESNAESISNGYATFNMTAASPDSAVSEFEAITVTVKADGNKKNISLNGGTVKDALLKADILILDDDTVDPEIDTALKDGDVISVTRAKNITVTADGKSYTVKLAKGTVEDAVKSAGIKVGEDDIVSKELDKQVEDGMKIKISRVTYKQQTVTETIKYKTVTQESDSMEIGKTKVTQKGVNGEKQVTYKIKYIDGEESDKTVVSEEITKKAVNKKITVGTKEKASKSSGKVPSQISWIAPPSSVKFNSNGKPVDYKKIMKGTATAYGPKDGTATSTGKKAKPGYVAVDPSVIPYGTKMYIVSADGKYNYGYAIAADTGGAARSGRILVDLYFPSDSACYDFGRRQVNIYILP